MPFLVTVVSFFVLYFFYWYQLIPKFIFEVITGKKTELILLGDYGEIHLLGIFLLSILCGWKVAQKLNPKIKNYAIAFKKKISQKLLLIISVISILISFNQICFFTMETIYRSSIVPFTGVKELKYIDIESVLVNADYREVRGGGRLSTLSCQLYTNITILSKDFTIEQKSLTYAETFDIGSILRQQGIISKVSYTNGCGDTIPEYRKGVIENSFDVKL